MDIWKFDLAFFFISAVLVAGCYLVRKRLTSPAWRDFLGITATLVVLIDIGFLMILGEHQLG
jgi:hypothetical protein